MTARTVTDEATRFITKDAKNAISVILSTSLKVAYVGVNASASKHYEAAANISAAITNSADLIRFHMNIEKQTSGATINFQPIKDKLTSPNAQVREQVKQQIAAYPDSQACLESALIDLTKLPTALNAIIQANETLAIRDYKAQTSLQHSYIKSNMTLLTKSVNTCIAKGQENTIFPCLDDLLLQKENVLSFISNMERNLMFIPFPLYDNPRTMAELIGTIISDKIAVIRQNITKCNP